MSEIADLAGTEADSFDEVESRPPNIPEELAILPLFNVVIYPQTVVPLAVGQEQSIKLIDEAVLGERMIGLVTLKNEQERPDPITPADFYEIGTAALVHRLLRLPDNTLRVAVQGVARIQIEEIIQTEPYFRARVRVIEAASGEDIETQSYRAILIEALGFFGDRDIIDESIRRFEEYRTNRSSLAPSLRSAVIAIVGRYSSQTVNHEILSMAGSARSSEEKRMYLRALGAALDPELARETLQYLVTNNVQPRDASLVFECVATEGEQPGIAWSFAVDHLKEIRDRFGLPGQIQLMASIVSGFTDDQRADEFLAFARANFPPGTPRELENSLQTIRFRGKLKAKLLPAMDDWIKAKT